MLNDIDITERSTLVITGDNCCSQYTSARNFFHLLDICNEYGISIIWISGVAAHEKNVVDTVGGVAKIAIRTEISCGGAFFNANECIEYLTEKFVSQDHPSPFQVN